MRQMVALGQFVASWTCGKLTRKTVRTTCNLLAEIRNEFKLNSLRLIVMLGRIQRENGTLFAIVRVRGHTLWNLNLYKLVKTMNTYIVAYDLPSPGQDYSGLKKTLEAYGVNQKKILNTTWLVKSNETAESIFAKLKKHLDADDRCVVFKLSLDSWYVWLPLINQMPNGRQVQSWLES